MDVVSGEFLGKIGALALLFVAAFGVEIAGGLADRHELEVWVFDIGQGDAIFIEGPERQVLVDGGPNKDIVEKLTNTMSFWDRSIDLVVNTHPHADHVTGLNVVMERYHVGEVWVSGQIYGSDAFRTFEAYSSKHDRLVQAGDVYDLGGGATLTVVYPKESLDGDFLQDPNAGSIVLLLEYGDTTILLPGDAGAEEERAFLKGLPEIDVLKIGHQGSYTSTSVELLERTQPKVGVISVGKNDYGHPHDVILNRLRAYGVEILRTDLDGDVRITSDGGEPEVRVWR